MSNWSEARVELLKTLYAEGHSATTIAMRLGGTTRNAVIGKAHRLGLTGTQPRIARTRRAQRSRAERQSKNKGWRHMTLRKSRVADLFEAVPFTPPSEPEVFIPPHQRKQITELADIGECKWPIGDPREKDFHFCGRKQVSGLPYCDVHCRRAYQPPQPQQRRYPSPAQQDASAKEEVHA